MKKYIVYAILLLITISSYAKVPFSKLYLEIEKIRYEGDKKLLKKPEKNKDKIETLVSYQKIWVDTEENSYLMLEEPAKDNDISEKTGLLKYNGRHFQLDQDMKLAWDRTDSKKDRIYDNYTTDKPNYIYYGESLKNKGLKKKKKIKCGDGVKRNANIYSYLYYDEEDQKETEAYIKTIRSSDMDEEDKTEEITEAKKNLKKKATKIAEWIWVLDNKETGMFLKKIEYLGRNVKIIYNITKLLPENDFDPDIFEDTLSDFKIKVIK